MITLLLAHIYIGQQKGGYFAVSKLNLRRFFTLLLALVMVLSIGATPVFANELDDNAYAKQLIETNEAGAPYIYFEANNKLTMLARKWWTALDSKVINILKQNFGEDNIRLK